MPIEKESEKEAEEGTKWEHGTLNVKSSVIHNNLKNAIESNLLSFSLTHTVVRPSVEANEFKGAAEVNFVKGTIEGNAFRFGAEGFWKKFSYERGTKRYSRSYVGETTSVSTVAHSTSYSTNFVDERSFAQHLGKRYTVTVPPHLDVAIIDASSPLGLINSQMLNGGFGWDGRRNLFSRKHSVTLRSNWPDTNYIFLRDEDIPPDALRYLEKLKEWDENRNSILDEDKFKFMLRETASPQFPGMKEPPFPPFKGEGMDVETAQSLGATCRLQVSHGANQTIQIFSQALRTIRFNNVSTIDNGKNSQIYLGGKYEHIRGRAHTLIEGTLVQHHRKIELPQADKNEPDGDGVAKYRYEDDASFAFVKADYTAAPVENLWSVLLQEEGLTIGNTKENPQGRVDPETLTQGLRITNESLKMIHGEYHIEFPKDNCIEFSAGEKKMTLDSNGLKVGDFSVRLVN